HANEESHADEEGHEDVPDEHVWLSLNVAEAACEYLAGKLGELDPTNKEKYTANAAAYFEKLNELDGEYQTAVNGAARKMLLFGDRFPFRYLVDDYGLDYYAAFVGCSAETEASFETIVFLAEKVDEEQLKHVMVIDGSDHTIAQTIIENTKDKNQDILVMDSMQSVTADEVASGASYMSIMQSNLDVLKQALA
ncbi:MAG TPA: zinc ABC transporter substrate-binding protein, partial [Ruminococcaceae bacterium]|nr:zinc ABC transporter substrate-binding protein [Oscillospiraceae bacterium]